MAHISTAVGSNRINLSISDQIYEVLKQEIIACAFMPGDRLLVQEIAKRFDVSQAPVREAFEKLKKDNLVDSRPNRGIVVSQITQKSIHDLIDVRLLIEGYAARNTVSRVTSDDLKELASYLDDMEAAMGRGDKWSAVKADFSFHAFVYHHCGNQLVLETWERIQMMLTRYMTISQYKVVMDTLVSSHRALYDAIRSGNADLAELAFKSHISDSIHMEILAPDA